MIRRDQSNMRWLAVSFVALTTFCNVQSELPSPCDMPMDQGHGKEVIVLLYYNKADDKCHPFHYGGQGGNENRFLSDKTCMRNCSSNAMKLYPTDEREACHLPKQYGHCMSRYLTWYYNPVKSKCKSFHYTGCGGNGNRFYNELLCNNTCAGITDDGEMDDEDDSDTPVGMIIGILLGVLGAIIMIVTIVISVQNKKPKTKETKTQDKRNKEDDSPLQTEGIEMK